MALQAALVPALSGESERTAQIVLKQSNVALSQTAEIQSGEYPQGVVVAQDPPAKSRAPNVSLLINRGEAGVTYVMPDLIGTSGSRVAEILRRRLFRVSIVGEVPYPGLPAGHGGAPVAPGRISARPGRSDHARDQPMSEHRVSMPTVAHPRFCPRISRVSANRWHRLREREPD